MKIVNESAGMNNENRAMKVVEITLKIANESGRNNNENCAMKVLG